MNSEGKRWRERFARLPAAVVRAVLIVAAVSKMADPLRFAGQLRGYGLVDLPQILALLAWALIAVECTLGRSPDRVLPPKDSLDAHGAPSAGVS